MRLVGISGSNGSGKDSIGNLLAERHQWLFVSVTELLRAEAARRGWPIERDSLRTISAEWRRKDGLGVLVDRAVEMYEQQKQQYKGLAISSLRNPGEADRVHELKGMVVWVDANPKVRYDRIYSRQRTAEDDKTFEEFLAEEAYEMRQSGDAATLDMSAVKDRSDIVIINNGNDLDEFTDSADKQLAPLL